MATRARPNHYFSRDNERTGEDEREVSMRRRNKCGSGKNNDAVERSPTICCSRRTLPPTLASVPVARLVAAQPRRDCLWPGLAAATSLFPVCTGSRLAGVNRRLTAADRESKWRVPDVRSTAPGGWALALRTGRGLSFPREANLVVLSGPSSSYSAMPKPPVRDPDLYVTGVAFRII